MPRRFGAALAALCTVAAALVMVVQQPVAATPGKPAGVGLLALRNGDLGATDTSRYGVVVMNAWEAGRIPAMKAANPGVEVLVYKDMSSTRSYAVHNGLDDVLLPTGVGYAVASLLHPDWFLTDNSGSRVEWVGYPGHWWMDVANQQYIDQWSSNVTAEVTAAGWDGVFVDNAMTSPEFYLPAGRTLAKYPDAASYQAATDRFLSVVGPRLKAAGLSVVPNMGGNFWDTTTYRRWVDHTSGALREHYGRWGADGNGAVLTDVNWLHQIDQQELVQAEGKTFLGVPYARTDDVAFQRYARASFLLAWDGGSSSLMFTPPSAGQDPWTPDATADIGLPTGPRTAVGQAWTRTYSDGVVVVNPTASATVTVALGRTYAGPDGQSVSSVTLAPASGMVLRSVAAPATTTTTAPAMTTPPTTAPTTTPTEPKLKRTGPKYNAVSPTRILDTRVGTGAAAESVGSAATIDVQVTGVGGVPSTGVSAVVLNVTAVDPTRATFLTAWPTGQPRPVASNLNVAPGSVVPNLVSVKVGTGGRVSLYNHNGSTHVTADVAGWYGEEGAAGAPYNALDPERILDTRVGTGAPAVKVGSGSTLDVQVTGRGGIPASGVTAVVLNVTAVDATSTSYLTAWPAGQSRPLASNLNYVPGSTVPNLVAVKVGTGGRIALYNHSGSAHLTADVAGWYGGTDAAAGDTYNAVDPARILDTRSGNGAPARVGAGGTIEVQVTGRGGLPTTGVSAVVVNVTSVDPTSASYLTVWPAGQVRPLASNLNYVPGQVVSNLVVVKVGAGGRISLYNHAGSTHVGADVAGWFSAE